MAEEFEEDPRLERNDLEVFREKAKTIEWMSFKIFNFQFWPDKLDDLIASSTRLAHQKDETVAEIRRLKNFFDAELVLLRNLKFAADVMLANAESRLVIIAGVPSLPDVAMLLYKPKGIVLKSSLDYYYIILCLL